MFHRLSLRLFILQAVLIVAMIPAARKLEPIVNLLASSIVQKRALLLSIIVLIILSATSYYRGLIQRHGIKSSLLHILSLAALIIIIIWIVKLPIEFTHIPTYALLCMFAAGAVAQRYSWLSTAGLALGAANLVSLADEGLQALHPERVADLRDLLINFLGAALGLALAGPFFTSRGTPDSSGQSI